MKNSGQASMRCGSRILVLVVAVALIPSAYSAGSSADDLLMRAALELAQEKPQAEAHLKQVISEAQAMHRPDLTTQAAQLLAISPLAESALQAGATRKRHVYAEMALSADPSVLTHADQLQLARVAADGFFDAKDLVRARKYYDLIVGLSQSDTDREAAHYARYRLAWVDWNENQPTAASDRLHALLSADQVKRSLRLLAAKDLGRLLIECPSNDAAGMRARADVLGYLLSDASERAEAARGLAQALKRLVSEEELNTAWRWLNALSESNSTLAGLALVRSLEVGEPWNRHACSTLDHLQSAPALRDAARTGDWSKTVTACLKKDTTPARTQSVLALAHGGVNGILGHAEVSGLLVQRLMSQKGATALPNALLQEVLERCHQICWKDADAERALWRAWAVALPHPESDATREAVDRYLEENRNASLGSAVGAQDWALELALSPAESLSPRLMERLRADGAPLAGPRALEEETTRRYLAMQKRGAWVMEETAAQSLPQWLGCALRTESYLNAQGVALEDACAARNQDWAYLNQSLAPTKFKSLRAPLAFTPRLPGRVERDLKQMEGVLRAFEMRTWTDARFLTRARAETHVRVIAPWLARLQAVAMPANAGPELQDLKAKLISRVQDIVAGFGGGT